MWSGPRNISTAMMRAFENRGDCAVIDEPFYAHYLAATGLDHPGREEVIATGETDWRKVAAALSALGVDLGVAVDPTTPRESRPNPSLEQHPTKPRTS